MTSVFVDEAVCTSIGSRGSLLVLEKAEIVALAPTTIDHSPSVVKPAFSSSAPAQGPQARMERISDALQRIASGCLEIGFEICLERAFERRTTGHLSAGFYKEQ